jgi:hypothetical protein
MNQQDESLIQVRDKLIKVVARVGEKVLTGKLPVVFYAPEVQILQELDDILIFINKSIDELKEKQNG